MTTLGLGLSFHDALRELLVENLLNVEANVTDSLGLKTIALRFSEYVIRKKRGDGGKVLGRKISEYRD